MRDMASTLYSTKDRHGISNISSYDSGVRRGCPFLDGNAERQEVAQESIIWYSCLPIVYHGRHDGVATKLKAVDFQRYKARNTEI